MCIENFSRGGNSRCIAYLMTNVLMNMVAAPIIMKINERKKWRIKSITKSSSET
jgi:hypothetical protein